MNTTRTVISVIWTALFGVALHIIHSIYSPLVGAVDAQQLNDTFSSYLVANELHSGALVGFSWLLFLVGLIAIWAKPVYNLVNKEYHFPMSRRDTMVPIMIGVMALNLSSCMRPVKVLDVREIKSNETAWAIPLDGSSRDGQVKFNSVNFLDQKKVAAKRIMIDKVERKIGRFPWDIEWIPATRVITVDRSLVTRQWTDGKSGTSADDQGIGVVTKDSVKLRVGLTVTASIDEDDASTYLYYHGSRSLEVVLDQNVRSYAVAELTREYSNLSLSEAQAQGDRIYKELFDAAKKSFKAKGVTIQYLGNAEGLTYADENVQQSINATYLAQQDVITAQQTQKATQIRNATLVMNAQAEADAASKLLQAKDAAQFKNDLNVRMMQAQAALRWNGALPANLMPSNSPMLPMFNVGGVK